MSESLKIGMFFTHPIQYWVPVVQNLSQYSDVNVQVYYLSMHSVEGGVDAGFGQNVCWDVPLLDGYDYDVLKNTGSGVEGQGFFRYNALGLVRLFRSEKFDAVLVPGYFCWYYLQVVCIARFFGVPAFFRGDNKDRTRSRSSIKTVARSIFLRIYYRLFRCLFATATYMKRSFLSHGIPNSRIFWAPHCVNSAQFEQLRDELTHSRQSLREQLGVSNDTVIFMFCGKLIAEKNVSLLLKSLAAVSHSNDVYALIVGDGPLRQRIDAEARELGLSYSITGFKNQTELPSYYYAADVVVLPSFSETWGLVINEAMIFGKPVIVSDAVGCAEDLVVLDENGFVFDAGDASSFKDAIEETLAAKARFSEMSVFARQHIRGFSPEVSASSIRAALLQCCVSKRPS